VPLAQYQVDFVAQDRDFIQGTRRVENALQDLDQQAMSAQGTFRRIGQGSDETIQRFSRLERGIEELNREFRDDSSRDFSRNLDSATDSTRRFNREIGDDRIEDFSGNLQDIAESAETAESGLSGSADALQELTGTFEAAGGPLGRYAGVVGALVANVSVLATGLASITTVSRTGSESLRQQADQIARLNNVLEADATVGFRGAFEGITSGAGAADRAIVNATGSTNAFRQALSTAGDQFGGLLAAARPVAPLLAGVFAVTAVAAWTVAVVRATQRFREWSREMRQSAGVADILVSRLNQLSAILQPFGIQTEQIADIINDITERAQDAAINGGAMAEAFDLLGVNVERFIQLQPEERLQALAIALERADRTSQQFAANELGEPVLQLLSAIRQGGLDDILSLNNELGRGAAAIDTFSASSLILDRALARLRTSVQEAFAASLLQMFGRELAIIVSLLDRFLGRANEVSAAVEAAVSQPLDPAGLSPETLSNIAAQAATATEEAFSNITVTIEPAIDTSFVRNQTGLDPVEIVSELTGPDGQNFNVYMAEQVAAADRQARIQFEADFRFSLMGLERLPDVISDSSEEVSQLNTREQQRIAALTGAFATFFSTASQGIESLGDAFGAFLQSIGQALIAEASAGLVAGLFGGSRQFGGPVDPGRAFLVGERGPELFVPTQTGVILPTGEGLGPTITFNVASGVDEGQVRRFFQQEAFPQIEELVGRGAIAAR